LGVEGGEGGGAVDAVVLKEEIEKCIGEFSLPWCAVPTTPVPTSANASTSVSAICFIWIGTARTGHSPPSLDAVSSYGPALQHPCSMFEVSK
jgi:hypothetical protein